MLCYNANNLRINHYNNYSRNYKWILIEVVFVFFVHKKLLLWMKCFFCHECVRFPPKSLPINPSQRVQNEMYLHKGTPVYWRGKILFCVHNVRRTTCKHTMCCDLKTHCEHELPLSSPCVKCARP